MRHSFRLLAMDLGNSNITLGWFQGPKLAATRRLATFGQKPRQTWERRLASLTWPGRKPPEAVAAASVVPEVNAVLTAAVRRLWRLPVHWVEATSSLPVSNRYQPPAAAGVDRLLNVVAAAHFYGAPAMAVDFGTAITLDAVSAQGEFLGGAILPGLAMSMQALHARTSRIPVVTLAKPRAALGRSTAQALRAGVVLGGAAAVESLIRRMRAELGGAPRVVATGGYARWIAPLCPAITDLDPSLTLQGLRLAWEYQQEGSRS